MTAALNDYCIHFDRKSAENFIFAYSVADVNLSILTYFSKEAELKKSVSDKLIESRKKDAEIAQENKNAL